MALVNFSWIDAGKLAASGQPAGMFGLDGLQPVLNAVKQQGIGLVVSLTEQPIDTQALVLAGLEGLHLPTPDMTAPTAPSIDLFLAAVDAAAARQEATLVHCRAGLGRTGTLAACYLVRQGLSAGEAIGRVRGLRPGSIETPDQETVVHDFADRHAGGWPRQA